MGYGKDDVQAQLWAPVRAVCEGIHLVLEAGGGACFRR